MRSVSICTNDNHRAQQTFYKLSAVSSKTRNLSASVAASQSIRIVMFFLILPSSTTSTTFAAFLCYYRVSESICGLVALIPMQPYPSPSLLPPMPLVSAPLQMPEERIVDVYLARRDSEASLVAVINLPKIEQFIKLLHHPSLLVSQHSHHTPKIQYLDKP